MIVCHFGPVNLGDKMAYQNITLKIFLSTELNSRVPQVGGLVNAPDGGQVAPTCELTDISQIITTNFSLSTQGDWFNPRHLLRENTADTPFRANLVECLTSMPSR